MSQEQGAKAESDRAKAPALSRQRLVLSAGYSMLYKDAGTLDLSELILYVKVESDAMDKVTTAVAEVGGRLKEDLERIAKDYPGVRMDLDPLSPSAGFKPSSALTHFGLLSLACA